MSNTQNKSADSVSKGTETQSQDKIAYINDMPYLLEDGETILSFLKRHHGEDSVPTLCDAPNLDPFGSCRVCSVDVAMHGNGGTVKTVASCHTPITKGMMIYPDSKNIKRSKKKYH